MKLLLQVVLVATLLMTSVTNALSGNEITNFQGESGLNRSTTSNLPNETEGSLVKMGEFLVALNLCLKT